MTRKLTFLTLLAALLLPLGAKAQTAITEFPYLQGFEDGLNGWTVIDDDGDGYNWTVSEASATLPAHSGSSFIYSGSYINYVGALTPDNWLVSPAITLGDTPIELSWWNRVQDANFYYDHYAVYVSTTGNTVDDFTDDPIFDYTMTSSEAEWTKHTVSLADYVGETIYIAFRHFNCTDVYIFHIDDISLDNPPMCTDPQDLEASDITTTGATLTWTAAATTTATIMTVNGESVEGAGIGSHTLTNLEPGTTYTVTVASICGEDTSDVASVIFHTLCNTFELPWFDGFEVESDMNCWSRVRGTSRGYYNGGSYAGTGMLLFESGAGAAADIVIFSPAIELPEGAEGLQLEYYVSSSSNGTYEVLISTEAGTDPDGLLDTLLLDTIGSSYTLRTINLDNYAGQTITLAFHVTTAALTSTSLYIDNIGIRNTSAPVVDLPATATADANMPTTFAAVIAEGVLDGMTYAWTSTMEAAGNATMTATDSVLSITYTAAGEDTITVVATNAFGSGTATLYVHVRNCVAIDSLPWLETFDSVNCLECWSLLDVDGNGTTWTRNTSGYLYGQYNSAGPDDWAITPAITIPEDGESMVLSWDVYGDSWSGLNNYYEVLVSPTAGTFAASFTDTLFTESYPTTTWASRTTPIGQYAGQTVRIAFRHVNTGDDNGMRIDNVGVRNSLAPVVALNGPAGAAIGDTATFTAALQEGSHDGLTYTFSSTMVTAGTATGSADTTVYTVVYTVGGIDTVTVIATNTYGSDTAVMVVTVRDLNPVTTLPYITGFEPGDDTSWFFDNSVNGWYIDSAAHSAGSRALYISADSGATYGYTVSGVPSDSYASRAIQLNAGEYAISFDWQANGEGTWDYLRAFLAPVDALFTAGTLYSGLGTTTTPANFIALDGGSKLNLSSSWQNQQTVFSIENAGTYQLVFLWHNDNSLGNQPPAAIDNIELAMLTCPKPANLAIDTTNADTIAFHWSPRGVETSWVVTVATDSAVVVDNAIVTDTFYMVEGLEPNTPYTVSIRALCDEGDTSFSLTSIIRTECGGITLPYFESFEDGGETCWRYAITNASNTVSLNTYTAADGAKSLRLYMYSSGSRTYAILPALDNVNTLMMNFSHYDYYDENNVIEVGTIADPQNINSFVSLFSTIGTDSWTEEEVRFNADTTGNRYIAFRATGAASATYVLIDAITVMVAPSCARPEGVSVSNVTTNGADVVIDDTTLVNNYHVIVVSGTDTVVDAMATDTVYTLTGLEANTAYVVTVNAVCDDGTATSSRTTSFRTDCEGGNCEFTVAMVDSYGDGWNGNAINVWQNGSVYENLTITSGSNNTVTVRPCLGDPVALIWQTGSYAYETSFSITDASDSILLVGSGSDYTTGDTLLIFDGACNASLPSGVVDTIPDDTTLVCDAPAIVAATPTQTSITLVWTGAAAEFEVAIVEGTWQTPANVTTTSAHNYVFNGLTAATQYTVGVRTICDDTVSTWTTRSLSTTQATDTTDTNSIALAAQLNFSLYPNPASSVVTVVAEGKVLVAVLDLNGRELIRTEEKTFSVEGLAKGAYFVRLTSEEGTAVRKLIVR